MVEPFCINSVLQQWLFGVVPSFAIKQFSLLRQSSTNPWAFAIHGSFDKEAFLCLCEHEVLQHVAAFVGQIFARSWDFGHASLSDHRKHSCSFLEVLGCQFDTHFAVSIGLYGLLGDGGSKVEEDGRLFRFDVAQCGFVFSFEGVFPHEKHRADLFLVVAEREPGFHDFEDPMVPVRSVGWRQHVCLASPCVFRTSTSPSTHFSSSFLAFSFPSFPRTTDSRRRCTAWRSSSHAAASDSE
mmetsp:Transcript_3237/g.20110  ORF Transcript_3237/g.20110 Transcript_3237/m.20110 type:complete len:240 (+) Transcript_3237:3644-4363(+)